MSPEPLASMRRILLLIILVAIAGMILDLALLKHVEGSWQKVPLITLTLLLPATFWLLLGNGTGRVHVYRTMAGLTLAVGLTGIFLHFRGSMEFQSETYPELGRWALFLKAIMAKAPPALAPGAMVQLGLLGLLATYGHPALRPSLTQQP